MREYPGEAWLTQRVHLVADALVAVVDDRDDVDRLAQVYPVARDDGDIWAGLPPEAAEVLGQFRSTPFDFVGLAGDVDALWVTQRGLAHGRSANRERGEMLGPLYMWDVETVLVLRPEAIASVDSPQ